MGRRFLSTHRLILPTKLKLLTRIPILRPLSNNTTLSQSELLTEYKSKTQTSVSLETLLDTGSGKLLHASRFPQAEADRLKLSTHERTVMQIASFLRHELPVRLAHRATELRLTLLVSPSSTTFPYR